MAGLRPDEILAVQAAILTNTTSLLAVIGSIVKTAREVSQFRKECLELANTCIALSASFDEAGSRLDDLTLRAEFASCLVDVRLLVIQCQQSNIMHVAWEVIVRHKVESFRARLSKLQRAFDTEALIKVKVSSSKTVESLNALRTDVIDLKCAIEDNSTERAQYLEKIRYLESSLNDSRRELVSCTPLPSSHLEVIPLPNKDVEIAKTGSENHGSFPVSGTYKGASVYFEQILYQNVKKVPRIVKIYEQISEVALVQELAGIVEHKGTMFAMMASMEPYLSVEEAIHDGLWSSMEPVHVLRYAYELAATLSALHAASLVVKVVSDQSVFVVQGDGAARPMFSNLDQARNIWETTNGTPQDIRFDAPETGRSGTRSKMSDVWSLGVLLQEILLQKFAYGLRSADLLDLSNRHQVQKKLQAGRPVFDVEPQEHLPALEIASECLAGDPYLRPTASSLAQKLFDELIRAGSRLVGTSISDHAMQFGDLGRRITSAPYGPASRDLPTPVTAFSMTGDEIKRLVQAAEMGNPSLLYLVGVAYLKGMIGIAVEQNFVAQPREVLCAKLAVQYLDRAEQLGHDGATKELLRAHKLLAKHYHGLLSKQPAE